MFTPGCILEVPAKPWCNVNMILKVCSNYTGRAIVIEGGPAGAIPKVKADKSMIVF